MIPCIPSHQLMIIPTAYACSPINQFNACFDVVSSCEPQQNIMLVLPQTQTDPNEGGNLLLALHTIMMTECHAQPLNHFLFRTFLPLRNKDIQLLWRYQPIKTGNLRLYIQPQLDQTFGTLRVDCQRAFVDLLRVISVCNRDKGRVMSFVVTQYSFVEMATMFSAEHLKDYRSLRKLIKNTLSQLPATLDRLLTAIRPFLEEEDMPLSKEQMDHNAVTFLKQSHKWLQIARQNQLQLRGQQGRKIDQQRMTAFQKLKDALRIITTSKQTFLQTTVVNDSTFSEWTNRNKGHPLTRSKEKNVFSVKVLAQTGECIQKDNSGSHCRITLATYKLAIAFSVNSEIATAAKQLKNTYGVPVVQQTTKQMQLVKKQVKNPLRQQSKNSFQNELDFIYYIRDRSCKYVSTYYWQCQIKRQDASAILMDYYPQNLREMLISQGTLLSFKEKLTLLQRIVAAVSWLASNFICHRDIKPENIMISQERLPKLVDFGSCCPVHGAGTGHLQVSETRLLATPPYFIPFNEQVSPFYKKNQYEQHMLFDAYSLGQVMRDVLEEGIPRILPNLPGILGYIMDRCHEVDPADRMTYQQMLFLLENLIRYLQRMEE